MISVSSREKISGSVTSQWDTSPRKSANCDTYAEAICGACHQPLCGRKGQRFCGSTCRNAHARALAKLAAASFPATPAYHLGPFQAYQAAYRGKLDVIITDPPYGREFLLLYQDLAVFAEQTLQPGGWLLCLTGWGELREILNLWHETSLEFITVCTYLMPGATLTAKKRTSTGLREFQQQAKPLLWYQQRGTKFHRRRAGTSDLVGNKIVGKKQMDREQFHWQQDLEAFKQIIWTFTNPQDVICDPCMGSGTTLVAADALQRHRVIGIEKESETYAQACHRIQTNP